MPLTLLVTGFGPFPHVRVNPTDRLAHAVAASPRFRHAGHRVRALTLETSYRGGLPMLDAALAGVEPDAVLMLGLAGKARRIRVERYARRSPSPLAVDARGGLPAGLEGDASPLPSTASLGPALARLRRAGFGARLSPSAGRYLCNAGYAAALGWARARDAPVPVLFVHVPWLRPAAGTWPLGRAGRRGRIGRPEARRLAAVLAEMGIALLAQARCAGMAQRKLA